jgi:hypothetical protein
VIRRYERSSPSDCSTSTSTSWAASQAAAGTSSDAPKENATPSTTSATRTPKRIHTLGCGDIHAAVDDHTRLANVEVLDDEKATTATEFTQHAVDRFSV